MPNSAYHFEGVSYIDVANNDVFDFPGDYTISIWLKYASPQNNGWNYSMVVCKNGFLSPGINYFVDWTSFSRPLPDTGGLALRTPDLNNAVQVYANGLVNDSNWHNHILMRQGDDLYIYIDGVMKGMKQGGASGSLANVYPLRFGANQDITSDQNYQGDMDEVRIYNRALNNTEIQQLQFNCSSSKLYYRSRQSGLWNDPNTWETSPLANFSSGLISPTTTTPNLNNAYEVTVRSAHVVTVTADVISPKLTVSLKGDLHINTGKHLKVVP